VLPPGECYEGTIDLCGYFAFHREGTYTGTLALDVRPLSDEGRMGRFRATSPEFRFVLGAGP
jgi:hypothetical protein